MDHLQLIPMTEVANNAYTMTLKRSLVNCYHQCIFCPPKKTLLKDIAKNQFTTWPGLTYAAVQKCLPNAAPPTEKGHMKRQRQDIRSTKEKVKNELYQINYKQYMNPPVVKDKQNHLFFDLVLID